MSRLFITAALTLSLAACQAADSDMRNVSLPGQSSIATELAGADTYLDPMPTAVIALKPDDMARNRAFCEAFNQLPTAQEKIAKSVLAQNLILTRWITQLDSIPAERARDCEYLVGTYDYSRAKSLMNAAQMDGGRFEGKGPFLIVIIPDTTGLHRISVDGSAYEAQDFPAFAKSWNTAIGQAQYRITENQKPGIVQSGFSLIGSVFRTVFAGTAALLGGI